MNTKELNWQDIRLFLAVAETGSFSAAARKLGLGQPTLSRRIAEFEEQLGQPLFIRLSLGCQLTALGLKLLPAAQQMALWSTDALTQIYTPDKIAGRVRITAPPGIAFALLAPFAAYLTQQFPEIYLEVLSSIRTLNLARGEADIALRTQEPNDPKLLCIKTFHANMKAYASKTYSQTLTGSIGIENIKWICWADDYDHLQVNQILKNNITDFKPAFTSDDYNVQIAACMSGVGAMVLPERFEKSSPIGSLVPLNLNLDKYGTGVLHLIAHERQKQLPRVMKVIECLQCYLENFWSDQS